MNRIASDSPHVTAAPSGDRSISDKTRGSHDNSLSGREARLFEWLVSVRDLAEAERASEFDIDLLDLKEPSGGSLAPVTTRIWREISQWAGGRWPISVALGEADQALELAGKVPPQIAFAKVGPSGCDTAAKLHSLWRTTRQRLNEPTELVAVAYADPGCADCVPPLETFALAAEFGFRRVVLDTFAKQRGSAIEQLGRQHLDQIGDIARQRGLWWSLAGSITLSDVEALKEAQPLNFPPDCIAVRGDVCVVNQGAPPERSGDLCRHRMRRWNEMLRMVNT